MSDTPKTDKRCSESQSLKSMSVRFAWMCDFARELELENAELRQIIAEARPYLLACGMPGWPKVYARMLLERPEKEAQP